MLRRKLDNMNNQLNEKKSEVLAYKQQMEENEKYYKEMAKVSFCWLKVSLSD